MTPSQKFYLLVDEHMHSTGRDRETATQVCAQIYRTEFEAMQATSPLNRGKKDTATLANEQRESKARSEEIARLAHAKMEKTGRDYLSCFNSIQVERPDLFPQSQAAQETALANERTRTSRADGGKEFAALVDAIRVNEKLVFETAWNEAKRRHPDVYARMN